jgi:hypothetical protein
MVKARKQRKQKEEQEESYEVEKIVNHKKVKVFGFYQGKDYYEIKWKGYSSKENTWEIVDNLSCDALIKEFEAGKKSPAKVTKKAGTPKRKRLESPKSPSKSPERSRLSLSPQKLDRAVSKFTDALYRDENELDQDKVEMDTWDDHIERVVLIKPDGDLLIAYVEWIDGEKSKHDTRVAKEKFPKKVM